MEVFLEKDNMTGFRLIVTDSAAGAKYYELEKTMDGGKNWTLANADPFDGKLGLAEGIEFFTKDNGYIGITDLTKASDIIASRTYEYFFPLILVALIYLLLTTTVSKLLKRIERKLDVND